jgi:dCMP deaminase
MATQSELDVAYLRMAYVWSSLSKAQRKKVGCLIVKDGAIISDGFNGTPKGFDNCCELEEEGSLVTKDEVLHAESNAISKLAQGTQSSNGATMYITIAPCMECAKLIIQAGIRKVVFREAYRSIEGLILLKRAGIEIDQVKVIYNDFVGKYA